MNKLFWIIVLIVISISVTACPQEPTETTSPQTTPSTSKANPTDANAPKTADSVGVNEGMKIGNTFPNIDILSETGTTLNIAALKGKVVLVNCFAHYCGPCKEEMPMLVKHFQANKDKGYALVLLPFDSTKTQIADFYKKYGGEAYRRDESIPEAQANKMAVFSYPNSFLLDKEGVIRKIWMGVVKEADLDAEIAKFNK